MPRIALAAAVFVAVTAAREARACDPACHPVFDVDAASILPVNDPGVPSVRTVDLQRPEDETPSTCGDLGTALIDVEQSEDPVGYLVTLGEGAPTPLCDFSKPVRLFDGDPRLHLQWQDSATKPLDFEVTIKAVNKRGHESAPTRIRIQDAGKQTPVEEPPTPQGCGASSVPVPALGVLAVLLRRRARRS